MQQENGKLNHRQSRSGRRARSRPRLRSASRLVTSDAVPELLLLTSPLHIFTEQHVTGVSSRSVVQFVTKILMTTEKISMDEHEKHYEGMVEAALLGTSRSSTSVDGEDPEEEFQCKIHYSEKAVYIYTVQNVKRSERSRSSVVGEEKVYSDVVKTRITGQNGDSVTGWLSVGCKESVSISSQKYTRDEQFTIGFRGGDLDAKVSVASNKYTFDPTSSIVFEEKVSFDEKHIGFVVSHTASAEMKDVWKNEMGSFGEEVSKYREMKFDVVDSKRAQLEAKKESPVSAPPPPNSESSYNSSRTTSSPTRSIENVTTSAAASSLPTRSSTPSDSSTPSASLSNMLSMSTISSASTNASNTTSMPSTTSSAGSSPFSNTTNGSSLYLNPVPDDGLPAPILLKKARSRSKRHKLLRKSSELKVVNPEKLKEALKALQDMHDSRLEKNGTKKMRSSEPPSKKIAPDSVYLYNTGANQSVYMKPVDSQTMKNESTKTITLSSSGITHEWIRTDPVKVSEVESSGMKVYEEDMHLEMLVDRKRFVIDLKIPIVAEKRPEVEVLGISFHGQTVFFKDDWKKKS